MATSGEITVGYWGIRGRGGVIRTLLAYCGVPFTNKNYLNPEEWFGKDKHELGFDYPNLPYILDGEKKLTESNAILHYIPIRAGKRELIGDTDDKYIQVEVAFFAGADVVGELARICFSGEKFAENKEESFTNGKLKVKLGQLNKNLEGKEWLTGFLSIADFQLYEIVDMITELEPSRLESYPNLTAFHKRFEAIPEIQAHRQSEQFIKLWYPPGRAAWTGL